uniref:UDP-galactose transporter senju n=1 Tax=Drosophila melanogaster TaxID=7227 RepID=SENJU_DROME|nr:senju [Drosophila melanogaster]Q9VMU8.2 RecName: Full=UDP-galactose transporter senju [Drosophila melanogaster]AAF52211.2 senju [Drosophila melanogaster]|eukprot:NP_608902.1 senju [Drosophila melanogaster]
MSTNWRELFPTKLTFVIFLLYMSLFIGQGIFVTASQESNNSYGYNTVTVVLLTEVFKLIVSTCLYCRDNNLRSLVRDVQKDRNVLGLYMVPAFLYCLYNNLAFVNLATFDPTTYYLLLQLRVVVTGILFQIIFKKYLSQRQWISLILLTLGCMMKQVDFGSFYSDANDDSESAAIQQQLQSHNKTTSAETHAHGKNMSGFDFSLSAVFILAQTICSCLAGVYNEYLLKDKGADVNIFVQNVFMYLDSIVCNAVILLLRGELLDAFSPQNLGSIMRFSVLIIIVNNAAIGIVTSFFLKYMNSILKTFASALELLFTAVLCYFLFSIPIYMNTALAIAVVSYAIYLYTQSPVVNLGKVRPLSNLSDATTKSTDKRKLIDEEAAESDLDMV